MRIDEWEEIHDLPGCWPTEALRRVLELADFDDAVSDDEAPEMALMALQDLGERKASELVLDVVFGEAMSSGVRQNVTDDLQDDRPWEQFAGVEEQAGLFEAIVLLQRAFPDAQAILWQVREVKRSDGSEPTACLYDLYSSWQWLGPLEDREPWAGVGWPDGAG